MSHNSERRSIYDIFSQYGNQTLNKHYGFEQSDD